MPLELYTAHGSIQNEYISKAGLLAMHQVRYFQLWIALTKLTTNRQTKMIVERNLA